MSEDKRIYSRLDLSKLAFAKEGDQAHGGLLKDISTSGAFIEFEYPLGRVEHNFAAGERIELMLEDETMLVGEAARAEENGVAIRFDPEDDDQRGFVEALVEAEWEMQYE